VNPAALAVADAARLLAKAGGEPVTEAMIAADISGRRADESRRHREPRALRGVARAQDEEDAGG
jgi:hypothetical protein